MNAFISCPRNSRPTLTYKTAYTCNYKRDISKAEDMELHDIWYQHLPKIAY